MVGGRVLPEIEAMEDDRVMQLGKTVGKGQVAGDKVRKEGAEKKNLDMLLEVVMGRGLEAVTGVDQVLWCLGSGVIVTKVQGEETNVNDRAKRLVRIGEIAPEREIALRLKHLKTRKSRNKGSKE